MPVITVLLWITWHNAREKSNWASVKDWAQGGFRVIRLSSGQLNRAVVLFNTVAVLAAVLALGWLVAITLWVSKTGGMYALISIGVLAVGMLLVSKWINSSGALSKMWRVLSWSWLSAVIGFGVVAWIVLPANSGGFWGFSVAW